MGTRKVQIANLPPEVSNNAISGALNTYGEVLEIWKGVWAKAYRYPIPKGILIAVTSLKTHIPSHVTIAGHRVLISYEEQTPTCYGCNSTDHQYQVCPHRKRRETQQPQLSHATWAEIVQQETLSMRAVSECQWNMDTTTV